MKRLAESELILNRDGSIYHLNVLPQEIANTIIVVGDPDRVPKVSKFFDRIEVEKRKRELVTHTGYMGNKRLTVLSTGMGPGNIDIVMNELDALANIDFTTRMVKEHLTTLNIIRLGTSGSLNPNISPGEILVNQFAIGFDTTLSFYGQQSLPSLDIFLAKHGIQNLTNYWAACDINLNAVICPEFIRGTTLTAPGFYGAQNRALRIPYTIDLPFNEFHQFSIENIPVTNMEMETACIYLFAQLMGHRALSINAILANRLLGTFADDPASVERKMIENALDDICSLES